MSVVYKAQAAPGDVADLPLPPPTADVARGLKNIAEFGVTIHPGFLSPQLASQIFARVEEQGALEREQGLALLAGPAGFLEPIESVPGDTRELPYQAVRMLPNKGRVFIDLMMHPMALAYASGVLQAGPFNLWSLGALITRRGLAAQGVHIDQSVLPPEMCTVPAVLNVFICLTDFEPEMGSTLIAPGTHRLPRPKPGQPAPLKAITARAGDAIVWEGRTWHCGGPHNSPATRYAISVQYALSAIRQNDVYPAALHDRVYETLSESELAMLGFRVESHGFSGRIGPRTPEDKRRNVNSFTPYAPELRR